MKIWVDADACPVAIKNILYRAAERAKVMVVLVANQALSYPASNYIRSIQVGHGFDVADNEIVQQLQEGDLLISSDIPLAADVLKKGGHALNPEVSVILRVILKLDSLREILWILCVVAVIIQVVQRH